MGVPGVCRYFLAFYDFFWTLGPSELVRYLGETHWGALPRLLKICKNSTFSLKIPLLQNFRMVENGCGGAPHTPKIFSMPKKVQSLPKTFFGHRDDVGRILESSGPKIAYFGRKIADCRIFGTQKCALWVRTTPQKIFRP